MSGVITVAVISAAVTSYAAAAQGDAAQAAADHNARQSEKNAKLADKKAAEDERQFRISTRKQEAANRARFANSGVAFQGSPLDLLRENATNAEADALRIKDMGAEQREQFMQDAQFARTSGAAAVLAANTQAGANAIQGAGDVMQKRNALVKSRG